MLSLIVEKPDVISLTSLLRDAEDDEDQSQSTKRWRLGFEGWFLGHSSNCPVYGVSEHVAQAIADWSQEAKEEEFQQTRRWASSDVEARAITDSGCWYTFNRIELSARYHNRQTGAVTIESGVQIATEAGRLHVLTGLTWIAVQPVLCDAVRVTPPAP